MLAHVNVAPGIDLEVRVRDPQGSVRGLAIVAHRKHLTPLAQDE